MRVLFITRSLQQKPGGMQTTARLLLDALRKRGDVSLRVAGWSGGRWGLAFFAMRAFAEALLFSGDAVHFGDASLAAVAWAVKRLRPRLHVSLTAHGLDVVYPPRAYQWMLHVCLPACDCVAAVSQATAGEVRARASSATIVVVPWGVLPSNQEKKRGSATGGPVLLSVGRQIRRKGTAWFIRHVLPLLRTHHPSLKYVVAGSGPESAALQQAVHELGLENTVSLLGTLHDASRDGWYRDADAFVMPNVAVRGDMEGFGMACLEASAHGLPVAAARLEGIPDAVRENETGLLFMPGNAEDAVRVVEAVLARSWDRDAIRDCCGRHYGIASVAETYVTRVFAPAENRHAHG